MAHARLLASIPTHPKICNDLRLDYDNLDFTNFLEDICADTGLAAPNISRYCVCLRKEAGCPPKNLFEHIVCHALLVLLVSRLCRYDPLSSENHH